MTQTHFELANALRVLAMDAVQKANSGHPGMPMGMADIAEVLWNEFLHHNPANPNWYDRDRFIISNGHGSMLLYSLLHLSGYDLSLEELKNFRQLHSKTPGHPEVNEAPGVETTTGPLGQGLANGVGMALTEKMLAAHFNRDDHTIVDHFTYVFTGDGGLMEGVSHEACSFAGTLGLGKLVVFWDDNGISIDGKVVNWFADDTAERFRGYHWQVIEAVDGHDAEAINQAIQQAQANTDQPTLICCKTQIGFGAPNKANTEGAHGAPLGDDEIALVREKLNWSHAPFDIPDTTYKGWDAKAIGQSLEDSWNKAFAKYETAYPELASEFLRRQQGHLPEGFEQQCQQWLTDLLKDPKKEATRKSSGAMIARLATILPEMIGGSADLSGSNCTNWKAQTTLTPQQFEANYIHYGVREFGMAAMMNGMALHGGVIPFGGTFLVFSDYARNAIRLAAMMKQRVIFVLSHDSIGLGEDGPTHQPIEQLSSLRLIPNLNVWRPCDAVETAVAWQQALQYQGPSALLLTRQSVEPLVKTEEQAKAVARGGYVIAEADGDIDGIVMATGSEVELAVAAQAQLAQQGVHVRVVSLPCWKTFLAQDQAYQDSVLPNDIALRVAIEAGSPDLWYRFIGTQGRVMGIDSFGLSAPYQQVYQAFGLTTDAIVQAVNELKQTETVA
ncbi:MAG: transketolase [Coxiellaceae bacterium]|nr:transketolase [Coxiellaceae bacterium]